MLRAFALAATFFILLTSGSSLMLLTVNPSFAAERCRNAKGKFTKCPEVTKPAPTKCKDAKGKFVKCSAPGAVPM